MNLLNPELEDVLQHYGVKGMKWGIRRQELKTKRLRKKDEKWKRKVNTTSEFVNAHNKSNTEMNRWINNEFNPKYKNAKLSSLDNPPSKWNSITKQYAKEYSDKYQKELNKYLNTVTSPSGNYRLGARVVDTYANVIIEDNK